MNRQIQGARISRNEALQYAAMTRQFAATQELANFATPSKMNLCLRPAARAFLKGGYAMKMIVNDWIHVFAGTFILISLALGIWIHQYWFFFTAFVGANLFQFGFTKVCPLGIILKKLGVPEK
ncbi:MAG: DUF2892 domain-containing protein [Desulfurivibrionaceae bacterium]